MLRFAVIWVLSLSLLAAEHRGVVNFGGLPLPGASVIAKRSGRTLTAITDLQGSYVFTDVAEGVWSVRVEMQLFAPQRREIAAGGPAVNWELEMLPREQPVVVVAAPPPPVSKLKKAKPTPTNTASPFERPEVAATAAPAATKTPGQADPETARKASDGILINGSVNNGAASPFAQLPAFGNFRRGARSMYNGSLGLLLNHSAFDARSYSITGQNTPKPDYSRVQGLFAFGGPLKIPQWLPRNGPMFTVNYQWTRNTLASTQSGLVPTERKFPPPGCRSRLACC